MAKKNPVIEYTVRGVGAVAAPGLVAMIPGVLNYVSGIGILTAEMLGVSALGAGLAALGIWAADAVLEMF